MQSPFVYAGRGRPLKKVLASTGNQIAADRTTTIPNNGYSEIFAAHEGIEPILEFAFAAAATGDVLIEQVADEVATVAGATYATVSVVAALVGRWNAGKPLSGLFRIKNTSGQSLVAYYNNRLS
jgi:hypothetical protein